ncbi:MAG: 4a-hydroxytetrahydrobiopterin dehydratase [Burkholderiaceae bacterium]
MNQADSADSLRAESCRHRDTALDAGAIASLLALLPGWNETDGAIEREYRFPDFDATIGFVNRIAAMANAQDHHPRMEVEYASCRLRWSTHSAGGLTRNDFICAARSDGIHDDGGA